MRRILIFCLITLVTGFFYPASVLAGADGSAVDPSRKVINVGIWSNQPSVIISADANFRIYDPDSKKTLAAFKNNEKAIIGVKESAITVNGEKIQASRLQVIADGKGVYIEVNKRRYRGVISIHRTIGKTGLTVVNTLPVEQYLYGIIASEMSPEWAFEAVKAQAVAARTYALYNLGKHAEDGFDVCATTHCQVYGGIEGESEKARKAVDDTAGVVILYQGKLIPAFFHSCSGGYTENSENVWGSFQPFLRAVPDYDQNSPHFKWEKMITVSEIEEILNRSNYQIGRLQAIQLSPLVTPPVSAQDRGVSGRVIGLRFIGTSGSVYIKGSQLRTLLGLNSTLFDISVVTPIQEKLEFQITDSYGDREIKKVDINMPPVVEKGLLTDKENIRRISGRAGETLKFYGFGWGHGVGLSQWGAKAMAEKAPPGDTAYFKEILKHYYKGVEITKAY